MYKGKKIVVCTPVGRKRSMKCLFKNILKFKGLVDEHQLWMNTRNKEDIDYINSYYNENKDFVTLKDGFTKLVESNMAMGDNVKHFYNYCIEPDTFYFKMDDDIILIESGMFEKLADYKLNHPETFLVYPVIINNSWCTHFLKKAGHFDIPSCYTCETKWPNAIKNSYDVIKNSPKVMSNNYAEGKPRDFMPEDVFLSQLYWGYPKLAEYIINTYKYHYKHNQTNVLDIDNIVLHDYEPVSINCIMFSGEDFNKFNGDVKCEGDEPWLTTFYPIQANVKNAIVGDARCVHYAYYSQREYLDTTSILEEYIKL